MKKHEEIEECTQYLQDHGFSHHYQLCKNWDIAHVFEHTKHNTASRNAKYLDMGCDGSRILKNLDKIVPSSCELHGIDTGRIPSSGRIQYKRADLMQTDYPDRYFDAITCLSVIEHEVDFERFATESSRILNRNGLLYVTFDYWEPKIITRSKMFGRRWIVLDKSEIEHLIECCNEEGLVLAQEIDWTLKDPVINPTNWAPRKDKVSYTFGMLLFKKAT